MGERHPHREDEWHMGIFCAHQEIYAQKIPSNHSHPILYTNFLHLMIASLWIGKDVLDCSMYVALTPLQCSQIDLLVKEAHLLHLLQLSCVSCSEFFCCWLSLWLLHASESTHASKAAHSTKATTTIAVHVLHHLLHHLWVKH